MAVKKILLVILVVMAISTLMVIASLPFANNLVEFGFLTGVNGRKLITIPRSGGIGVGLANVVTITGFLLTIGAAVHAATGIRWANSSEDKESQ